MIQILLSRYASYVNKKLTFNLCCDRNSNLESRSGMKTAVIILFHGSATQDAADAALHIAEAVKLRGGFEIVETAFLRHQRPTLSAAIESAVRTGARRIAVVPFFMQPGGHVTEDVPALVDEAGKSHPGLEVILTDHVGSHPLVVDIVLDLVGKRF